MKSTVVASGIVFLILFSGAHWLLSNNLLPESWIWVGLAVALVVVNYIVGRSYKVSEQIKSMWMLACIFGFVLTLAAAAAIVQVPLPLLLVVWLLLHGAAIAVGGFDAKRPLDMFLGVLLLFSALFVPSLGAQYLLGGAIMFGFLFVLYGYFIEEKA